MRMFFEPLNEWANGFEKEFKAFMKGLKYFFDKSVNGPDNSERIVAEIKHRIELN